jgi:hypothetical protein
MQKICVSNIHKTFNNLPEIDPIFPNCWPKYATNMTNFWSNFWRNSPRMLLKKTELEIHILHVFYDIDIYPIYIIKKGLTS